MNIVLASDGSSYSTFAVQALAHFKPPKELTLVHAMALPDLNYPLITPHLREEAQKEIKTHLTKTGEAILDQAEQQLPADFPNIQRIHQAGHPVDVILETAKSSQADLIIMGARGLGQVKELVLGSVSHRVLLHAPCSTLIVKSPVNTVQKILLPIEGEADANLALKFLAMNPFRGPLTIQVFTVWPQPQLAWPTTVGQSQLLEAQAVEEAQTKLDIIVKQIQNLSHTCLAQVGIGAPAVAILEQAKAFQPDLIMMGTHDRGGLSRFLMGSVSHSVLHQTTCPVLIIR